MFSGTASNVGRGAVCVPVPRGEKPSLYGDKNEMEDFGRSDILVAAIQGNDRQMSNDKLRAVEREVPSELRQHRRARPITTQPVKEVMDRPQLLWDRFRSHGDRREIENGDVVLETMTLPLEAARRKVRGIIGGISQRGYQEVVERWRQLPNGQIEFTVRHLPFPD